MLTRRYAKDVAHRSEPECQGGREARRPLVVLLAEHLLHLTAMGFPHVRGKQTEQRAKQTVSSAGRHRAPPFAGTRSSFLAWACDTMLSRRRTSAMATSRPNRVSR